MIRLLSRCLNAFVDFFVDPPGFFGPWAGMFLVSIVSALLVLIAFKLLGRREKVRKAKEKVKARMLEAVIYRDSPMVAFGALGRAAKAQGLYVVTILPAMTVACLLLLPIMSSLSGWYSRRPAEVGEDVILKVRYTEAFELLDVETTPVVSETLKLESPVLRIQDLQEANWRIGVVSGGSAWIEIPIKGRVIRKTVVTAPAGKRVIPDLRQPSFAGSWANPVEDPIEVELPVISIEVVHPARKGLPMGRRHAGWLPVYIVLTLVFALLLQKPLRVEL